MPHGTDHPANRLAGETSPYLLQHQHNPVDWYPWGRLAIERSKAEDRPIFLSIGYSACHWCHVMERESFENPEIAALMNEYFVNVKVDREERPDLDQIYMNAVQAMTGHGGWPMSVFLTPDLKPFYGGTYFPPADARGMPGFPRVLISVAKAWKERRDEIAHSAGEMTEQLQAIGRVPSRAGSLTHAALDHAFSRLSQVFDNKNGGFGDAPKFPHPMDLRVLLRHYHRTGTPNALHMARLTLDKMRRGGIYDHLGGGFARYSTDDRWLAPHFEKMLYDNALLASVYLEAYQVTRNDDYAQVARETLDYVLSRMTSPEGGFYATEDADSEGVEGKYYVWSLAEITEILGDERARTFAQVYDVTERGNWEESNILNLPRPLEEAAKLLNRDLGELREELKADRTLLLESRERRIPPGKDTKVITAWNGLMLAALADGSRILRDGKYAEAASKCADFLLKTLVQEDGRLLHTIKDGRARLDGYLDDYACLIDGLVRVFESSGEPRWIEAANSLTSKMIDEFRDPEGLGFFYTGKSHETLIARPKDVYDNATPSSNAMAATALLRLGEITGNDAWIDLGRQTIDFMGTILDKAPTAAGQGLVALDFLLASKQEIAIVAGHDSGEYAEALNQAARAFRPHAVTIPRPSGAEASPLVPFGGPSKDGKVTLYLCENRTCEAPAAGMEAIGRLLG